MINRYTRPEMGSIWEDENRYAKWLDVEIAACEAMSEEGTIPAKSLKVIKEKAGFPLSASWRSKKKLSMMSSHF